MSDDVLVEKVGNGADFFPCSQQKGWSIFGFGGNWTDGE
jgi:hypothetical protein